MNSQNNYQKHEWFAKMVCYKDRLGKQQCNDKNCNNLSIYHNHLSLLGCSVCIITCKVHQYEITSLCNSITCKRLCLKIMVLVDPMITWEGRYDVILAYTDTGDFFDELLTDLHRLKTRLKESNEQFELFNRTIDIVDDNEYKWGMFQWDW